MKFTKVDKKIDILMDMVKWQKYKAKSRVIMMGIDTATAKNLKQEVIDFLKDQGVVVNKMRFTKYCGMMDFCGYILEDYQVVSGSDKFNVIVEKD